MMSRVVVLGACVAALGLGCEWSETADVAVVEDPADMAGAVLTDSCTGEEVGQVGPDGTILLDSGLVVPASSIALLEGTGTVVDTCRQSEDGTLRQAVDTGSVLSLYAIACNNTNCCQLVVVRWCWNGSCSMEAELSCE